MPLVIPLDHINVHFGYAAQGDDQLCYTSLGFQVSTGLGNEGQGLVAQDINAAWQTSFKGVTAAAWAMTGSRVTLGATEPPYLSADLTGTTVGEGGPYALPNNCAVLLNKTTSTPGRSGRGRMYVPGLDNNTAFVTGRMDPNFRQDWQDAVDEFLGLVSLVVGWEAHVLFHDSDSAPSDVPSFIYGLTVNTQIATQRRRMR